MDLHVTCKQNVLNDSSGLLDSLVVNQGDRNPDRIGIWKQGREPTTRHLISKWRKIHCSFVSMLIGPCCLFLAQSFFEFCRWDRGNQGPLTMRQKSNVFSTILE